MLRIAPLVMMAVLRVRLFGVKNALAWSHAAIGARSAGADQEVAAAVERAARYMPGTTCLTNALALTRALRKNGVPASVKIGVDANPTFAAHAWVEVNGVPLADVRPRFTPLPYPR